MQLEKFEEIVNSYINGQRKQMVEQIDALSSFHGEKAIFASWVERESTANAGEIWIAYFLLRGE